MPNYYTGSPITYSATAHTDGFSDLVDHTYAWTFDDSTSASGHTVSKTWSTIGNHQATITATNTATGLVATASKTITVQILAWSSHVSPPTSGKSQASNGSILVAVGQGTDGYATIFSSTDGLTWTQRLAGNTTVYALSKVAYGNGIFVAVGVGTNLTATSTDGINWTLRNPPVSAGGSKNALTFFDGNFYWMPVTDGADQLVYKSSDGITWTLSQTISGNPNLIDMVGYVGVPANRIVAVGYTYDYGANAYTSHIYSSTDGTTFTEDSITSYLPAGLALSAVTVNGSGRFVAVGSSLSGGSPGVNNVAYYDVGGVGHWVSAASVSQYSSWSAVTFGNGYFVAVEDKSNGSSGTSLQTMYSADGVTWTSIPSTVSTNWNTVTYYNGKFIALPNDLFTSATFMYLTI